MTRILSGRWASGWWIAALLAASAYLVHRLTPAASVSSLPSFDIYSYAYPMLIAAADAVRHGGQGLFWNPLQECGQPFLATGMTGVLYPPFLFFLVLEPDHALRALLFFNVAVGTIGSYLLCREIGLARIAAVGGALAFGCSNAAIDLITSTPILSGPYAWLPLAMLFCERILRRPTLGSSAAMGGVLTLALLPGHPQVLVFIYQVLGLRVLYEMLSRRSLLGLRVLGFLLLGVALPPLLGAVHLLPALDVMQTSVRSASLSLKEIEGGGSLLTWEFIRNQLARRQELFNPFTIVLVMLASAAFAAIRSHRQTIFYAILVLVSADLAMGSNGFLFQSYSELPLTRLFRAPDRFQWMTAFGVAMLVAIGVDAVASLETRAHPLARRLATLALPAVAIGLLYSWAPSIGTRSGETACIVLVVGACAAAFVPRLRGLAAVALVAAIFVNVLYLRQTPLRTLLPDGSQALYANAYTFRKLQGFVSAQDRIHIASTNNDHTLQQKTGALFGIPALNDYQSLSTFRFANYFTALRLGGEMNDVQIFYFVFGGMLPPGLNRRLLNLAAVRYIVVDSSQDKNAKAIRNPPLNLLFHHAYRAGSEVDPPRPQVRGIAPSEYIRIYENPVALARARWVPTVAVEPDPSRLLQRLIARSDNAETVALVEEAPASGFLGEAGPNPIVPVEFVRNDPEHVVLEVNAPRRGFVVLADQWDADWHATVNGASTAILRANYLFRAVEVPAGTSTVEFRYHPAALLRGMLVSGVTAVALLLALFWTRRRARRHAIASEPLANLP